MPAPWLLPTTAHPRHSCAEPRELDEALARPDVIGGTAPRRVAAALRAQEERLGLSAG